MSLVWDSTQGKGRPVMISEEIADRLAEHSGKVCEILAATHRRPWPTLKKLPDLPSDYAWIATLDMAADAGTPFWCDDRVLGSLAANMNIPTFGTVDLLRHLAMTGQIDRHLAETAEAILIRNYHVDLGFNLDVLNLAATLDRWEAAGAAFALSRPYTWIDP
jgi:hypothetical protein